MCESIHQYSNQKVWYTWIAGFKTLQYFGDSRKKLTTRIKDEISFGKESLLKIVCPHPPQKSFWIMKIEWLSLHFILGLWTIDCRRDVNISCFVILSRINGYYQVEYQLRIWLKLWHVTPSHSWKKWTIIQPLILSSVAVSTLDIYYHGVSHHWRHVSCLDTQCVSHGSGICVYYHCVLHAGQILYV